MSSSAGSAVRSARLRDGAASRVLLSSPDDPNLSVPLSQSTGRPGRRVGEGYQSS